MSDSTQDATPGAGEARGFAWNLANLAIGAGLAVLAFAVYFLPAVLGRPVTATPEVRVAAVAREMLQSGNYVVPTLGGEVRLTEQPMPYWLAALSSSVFFSGKNSGNLAMSRAAMLPPAFSVALAVLLVVFFGARFFDRRAGIMAGLILGASHLAAHFAQTGYGDSTLMLACTAAVCGVAGLLSEKPGLGSTLLTGLALGVAILTKGFVPLALIPLPLVIEAILRRNDLRAFNFIYIAMAFVIALLVATPWLVLAYRQQPAVINAMLNGKVAAISASHDAPAPELPLAPEYQTHGIVYYFTKMATGLLPWTPIFSLGIFVWILTAQYMEPAAQPRRGASRFFALYAASGFLLLLIVPRRHAHYLLPLLPALALTAGAQLSRLTAPGNAREERMGWSQLAIGIVGATILACVPLCPAIASLFQDAGRQNAGGIAAQLSDLSAAPIWLAALLALGFFLVNFLCARFWTGGNGLAAVAIFAAQMLGFHIYATVRPSERESYAALWTGSEVLKKQTDTFPAGTRFFAAGPSEAQMIFYTGKSVKPLYELAIPPQPNSGRSVIITPAKTTTLFGVDLSGAARPVSDEYALIDLPLDSPLEAALRDAMSKKPAVNK